ncbi:MAG: Omp28 family outer membrane lipoprotein [Paludibacteraceae bacterium]|nr:Omp28 family outer membrane lipoprotein [Paludibacteraceae bacterium]
MKSNIQISLCSLLLILGSLLTACQVIPQDEQLIEVFTPADSTSFKRTSLLIEFSGWRCVNCPNAAEVAHGLKEQYGEELIVVVMHPESNPNTRYGNNQSVNYTCPEADSIYVHMGGTSTTPFPTGNVNMMNTSGVGAGYFFSENTWATLLSQASREVTRVRIEQEITHTNDNSIDIEVNITNQTDHLIDATLQVWLTEDNIVGKQKMPDNTTNDAYIHNHLLRASISPLWGTKSSIATGESDVCIYHYTLPDKVIAENCNVVSILTIAGVVVQVKETKLTKH